MKASRRFSKTEVREVQNSRSRQSIDSERNNSGSTREVDSCSLSDSHCQYQQIDESQGRTRRG